MSRGEAILKLIMLICFAGNFAAIAGHALTATAGHHRNRKGNGGNQNSDGGQNGLRLSPFQTLLLGILAGFAGMLTIWFGAYLIFG